MTELTTSFGEGRGLRKGLPLMIFVSGKRCRMWTKNQATQSLRLDLEKVAKKCNGVGRGAAVAVRAGV